MQAEAEELRKKINRFRTSLGRFFVAKAGNHRSDGRSPPSPRNRSCSSGPPGTAKSDLVLKFKDAIGVDGRDYFEYMLTRFTEPSEIIGPIDINLLRDGRYIRRKQGKLPTARLAFLDEIFKSNSAILNILLTIINEKKFYQDGVPEAGAAARSIRRHQRGAGARGAGGPQGSLRAQGPEPIGAGGAFRGTDRRGPAIGGESQPEPETVERRTLHADDMLKANRYLTNLFARKQGAGRREEQNDRRLFFPAEVFREFQRLVKTLVREDSIFISDRKLVKLYKLLPRAGVALHRRHRQPRRLAAAWPIWAKRCRKSSTCRGRCRSCWGRCEVFCFGPD